MPRQKDRRPPPIDELPSAATLFRVRLYDQASADLIRGAKEKLKPLLKLHNGANLQRIQAASTPEELLDLSPQATGLAQDTWHARMRTFGPAALPLIQQTLRQVRTLEDHEIRYRISALLITELRWQGEPGARALLACLDDLDEEAACLACVVLGLSHLSDIAEKVWECYLRLKARPTEPDFIGGLWALIDLQDRRVAGELAAYLIQQRYFYELFGFLSLAGDERALAYLMAAAIQLGHNDGADPLMAAAGIAHRVGKPILIRELLKGSQPDLSRVKPEEQSQVEEIAEMILARSPREVEEHFALFYRGFRPQDAREAFRFIRQNKD